MKKMNRMIALLIALLMGLTGLTAALADIRCQEGDTGSDVLALQTRLAELGYLTKTPDGVFDAETAKALTNFQARNGLLASGIADDTTWNVLYSDGASPWVAPQPETEEYEMLATEVYDGAYYMAPTATAMPNARMSAGKGMDGWNTDEYTTFTENGFQSVASAPLSTFAADVDTASYAKLRAMILEGGRIPADAVRVEEMLNYFAYDYAQPADGEPFGVTMRLAPCPWNEETLLLQVGVQARTVEPAERPAHNLVFLIDVSGSMYGPDRLDLVKRAFMMMLDELAPTDTVSIVTYASRDEVVLEGVPAADKVRIMEAISGLEAGGSTNSASGIQTAYQLAERYRVPGGVNRILMATDGDFNVGVTSEGELVRLVSEKKRGGVTLTMLGVGRGNYKDNKMEALADNGDGNAYYLDSIFEARRALVTEAGGTFIEVARDVKFQLDFNPARVAGYRLIGYEDRVMAAEDFADDTKDGGEIGSGHRVTALYEIVPAGSAFDFGAARSKYTQPVPTAEADGEWLTVNIRWKEPGGSESRLAVYPLTGEPAEGPDDNMAWAAAVAEAAMLLRGSEYAGTADWQSALDLARSCGKVSGDPYKEEFVYLLTLLQRAESIR